MPNPILTTFWISIDSGVPALQQIERQLVHRLAMMVQLKMMVHFGISKPIQERQKKQTFKAIEIDFILYLAFPN